MAKLDTNLILVILISAVVIIFNHVGLRLTSKDFSVVSCPCTPISTVLSLLRGSMPISRTRGQFVQLGGQNVKVLRFALLLL